MKMRQVLDLEMIPVSLRRACDMRRACSPMWRIAHVAFDLGGRHERGDAVDDDDVNRAAADERVGDFQRLLPGVGLRHEKVVDVNAEVLGIIGVKGVFGVDEHRDAPCFLRVGDGMQRERGFSRMIPDRKFR